jgi:hypothetical protein
MVEGSGVAATPRVPPRELPGPVKSKPPTTPGMTGGTEACSPNAPPNGADPPEPRDVRDDEPRVLRAVDVLARGAPLTPVPTPGIRPPPAYAERREFVGVRRVSRSDQSGGRLAFPPEARLDRSSRPAAKRRDDSATAGTSSAAPGPERLAAPAAFGE